MFLQYIISFSFWPKACYEPSLTAQYTEDSEWTPFDLFSNLVKEWEASALLPENVAKITKQVVIRSGTYKVCISFSFSKVSWQSEVKLINLVVTKQFDED